MSKPFRILYDYRALLGICVLRFGTNKILIADLVRDSISFAWSIYHESALADISMGDPSGGVTMAVAWALNIEC